MGEPVPIGTSLDDTIRRVTETVARTEGDIKSLPCRSWGDVSSPSCEHTCGMGESCRFAHDAAVCPAWRRERRAQAYDLRLERARVPQRERRLLVAHERGSARLNETNRAWQAAQAWARDNAIAMLVLSGPPGIGKTLAASCVLGDRGGLYTTAYVFARPDPVGTETRLVEAAKRVVVLVIDQMDFDGTAVPAYAAQQIREVLDARYADHRRTILICNQTQCAWERDWGPTIADRLAGSGQFIALSGRSLRRTGDHK